MNDALISIKPDHVNNIKKGLKTVELRTRNISLSKGAKLWIYSTLPIGCIEVVAEIDFVITSTPRDIWKKYSKKLCISRTLFMNYTKGHKQVTAIGLKKVEETDKSLCLKVLRKYDKTFTPPQYFIKLTPDKKISNAFA